MFLLPDPNPRDPSEAHHTAVLVDLHVDGHAQNDATTDLQRPATGKVREHQENRREHQENGREHQQGTSGEREGTAQRELSGHSCTSNPTFRCAESSSG